VYLANLILDAS